MTYAIVIAIFSSFIQIFVFLQGYVQTKLHPRRSAAEKGDCFFSCIAFSKFITGISFFQLFHYLTAEDSHSGTIDVVVKTTSGGIAPTIYIERIPLVKWLAVGELRLTVEVEMETGTAI